MIQPVGRPPEVCLARAVMCRRGSWSGFNLSIGPRLTDDGWPRDSYYTAVSSICTNFVVLCEPGSCVPTTRLLVPRAHPTPTNQLHRVLLSCQPPKAREYSPEHQNNPKDPLSQRLYPSESPKPQHLSTQHLHHLVHDDRPRPSPRPPSSSAPLTA